MNCLECNTPFDEKEKILCPNCSSQGRGNIFLDVDNCINFFHRINRKLLDIESKLEDLPEFDRRSLFGRSVITFNLGEMIRLKQMAVNYGNSDCALLRIIKNNVDYYGLLKHYESIASKIMLYDMMSYLTMVLFQLEIMIKKISIGLGYRGQEKYYNYCKYLSEKIPVEDDNILDTLTYPSFLRNVLHNNGIYTGYHNQDKEFTINGATFTLFHGKQSLVSWRLIIFMITSLIPVVEKIIDFTINENMRSIE